MSLKFQNVTCSVCLLCQWCSPQFVFVMFLYFPTLKKEKNFHPDRSDMFFTLSNNCKEESNRRKVLYFHSSKLKFLMKIRIKVKKTPQYYKNSWKVLKSCLFHLFFSIPETFWFARHTHVTPLAPGLARVSLGDVFLLWTREGNEAKFVIAMKLPPSVATAATSINSQ